MNIVVFLTSILVTIIIIPFIKNLLLSANITSVNYKKNNIPISMGITFIPVVIINAIVLNYFFKNNFIIQQLLLVFLVGIITMAVMGLIDDFIGSRETLGLKGHLKSLLKGKLTTGGLKAIVGCLVSLFISSLFSFNITEVIINTFIISLFTNFINLLDLRPGRAIKGFLFISILFIFSRLLNEVKTILLSFIGYAIAYLPQDIRAKSMMGDVGSNSLGIILGIVAVINYNIFIKYIILVLLIVVHIITEKYSLTKIIEENSILNFFDKLGN